MPTPDSKDNSNLIIAYNYFEKKLRIFNEETIKLIKREGGSPSPGWMERYTAYSIAFSLIKMLCAKRGAINFEKE